MTVLTVCFLRVLCGYPIPTQNIRLLCDRLKVVRIYARTIATQVI
jgi:hypothetical protein